MPDFSDMSSIRELYLNHSPKLTEPIILQRLEKLELLDLGYCHRLKTSPDFSKLPNLNILFLNDCKSLSEIHPSLSGLSKLQSLYLENCNLTNDAIPKDLGGLSSLEVLDLSGNEFSGLPSLSGLSELRSLYLNNCNLTNDAIPKDLGGLSSLEVLDLSGNEFSGLPSLSGLSELWCLYLKNCNLTNDAIPKDLRGLSSLKVLDLSGNEFSGLPSLSGLSKLRCLYLKNCNLTNDAIPKDLRGLSSLKVLDLSGNEFSGLPSLSGLSKLRCLYLKNCNLTNYAIPKDLGGLSSLKVLDLSGNEFSGLPSLSGLSKLRCLYLKNCNLTNDATPKDLGGLSSLEEVAMILVGYPVGKRIYSSSAASSSDEQEEEEEEGEVGEEGAMEIEIRDTVPVSEGCSFTTSNDDDSSSTTTVSPNERISQNGRLNCIITHWEKGYLLGSGSFGSVYEAISDGGCFFAVKEVSLLDKGSQGKQRVYQLEQEIALLSQFEHHNIVQYYGAQKDESNLYIFLELVAEGSLQKLYKTYPLADSHASEYTRQILHGLKYLHDRKVVHRDIKCANVLVHVNGSVKLADFGLAKTIQNMNDIKSCQGTAFWMAPEDDFPKVYLLREP
ncbi:protein suppressor of npr1-1 [Pyrus ussuriensis x Pyrus communis]|uniref:mitogen-activated protein kinase kinase kinase n=1 Tax=Pyrus ussuriensis x Pyrus communis TaxID=2448454 RepID=A0A5N5GR98_9ROSA|nr:protein suppressor of npr1-1 [Pyrus ussuriensis x Pyrus communis]